MRIRIISIIIIFFISSPIFAQSGLKNRFKQSNNAEVSKKKSHTFQSLFPQDSFNINDSLNKAICLDFLNSILYFNIPKHHTEIEKIYNENINASTLDTAFYLQCLSSKSLLSYQQYNFKQAIKEFRTYFKVYQSYYHTDTSYAFEYSKYSFAIQKTKPKKQFFSVIDSAIQTANKRTNSFNDLTRSYIMVGNYFMYKRKLDTARYLFNKAKFYINQSPNQDFTLESELSVCFGNLELLNSNKDLTVLHFSKALEQLLKTEHANLQIANIYKNNATALYYNNRMVDAINQFKMALYIFEKELPPNHQKNIMIYRFIGLSNLRLGKDSTAIAYFTKAVNLDSSPSRFFSSRNLAQAYSKTGLIKKADSLFQISINQTIQSHGSDSYQASTIYHVYGQFLLEKLHDYPKGEEYLGNSIQLMRNIYKKKNIDIARPLNILGTHYLNTGRIDEGLDTLQSALIMAIDDFNAKDIYVNPEINKFVRQVAFHNTQAWKAYGLYLKYLKTNEIKDLKMSFDTYDQFIYLAKEMRKYYKDTENIINAAELEYVYGQAVDIGRQLYDITNNPKYIAKIFEFIEGKKSFTLLNSLSILENKKLLKVPKELLNREADLKAQMGKLNELLSVEKKYSNNSDTVKKFESQVFSITQSLDSIQTTYKENYSEFYNLKYGFKELSLQKIEAKIPDNQAFLNYSLSDSLLSILCITKNGTQMFNQTIDSTFYIKVDRMVKLLKKFNTDDSYTEFHQFLSTSRKLYIELIEPAEEYIKGKELIIIPDGVLNYISFDALLSKDIEIERPDYRCLPYLIKTHKTNVANSMQIYYNMKTRVREAKDKAFAFAPYYQESYDTTGLPTAYQYLRPLDYAKDEINAIAQYLPTNLFQGLSATEDTFSIIATDAKILHLAMHTLINDEDPMYSKLLFTYDKEKESGLVNTYELLTMNLNAELAVLSGCSTGDGELQKGEGVMSLSSGFQYAGVPAIIMSLWEVNDRFGSLVIENFYTNIAEGLPKNQALHQAKLKVLSQGNAMYAHPFYWSGLTLMGDDSKINFENNTSNKKIILVFLILFISAFIFYKFKKKAI